MREMASSPLLAPAMAFLFLLAGVTVCHAGITSPFVRKAEKTVDMPLDSDVFRVPPGYNAPQQVHITQGNHDGSAVIVSWVTEDEPGSSNVLYGTSEENLLLLAQGHSKQYHFYNYKSGFIHHCTLGGLKFDTKYFYKVGIMHTPRTFSFKTPPKVGPDVPYTFGLIGDLGQSYDSNKTLTHYESNPDAQAVLFVGDLSYADNYPNHDNNRWDTWGRFVERSTAYQPWIWTAGNHELDFAPEIGETVPFKPFKHRYHTPYKASGSTDSLWYSIKRASAYIIVLSTYSAYGKYTPQYKWLEAEFPKVNRSETPWLIVMTHAPWYNSYNYHYIGCRWVSKTKLRADGKLDRLKARLVAKGSHQQDGINYTETFSPVVRLGSIHLGLFIKASSTLEHSVFSDVDWGGCPSTCRSTTGYCTFLGSNLISWSAKKQPTVARSSTEVEYRAMAATTAELTWLSLLLRDLGVPQYKPAALYCDNISALHMSVNPVFHAQTKHIEIDYHYVHEKVALGHLVTKFVISVQQIADIFTKPLAKRLLAKLGLLKLTQPNLRGNNDASNQTHPIRHIQKLFGLIRISTVSSLFGLIHQLSTVSSLFGLIRISTCLNCSVSSPTVLCIHSVSVSNQRASRDPSSIRDPSVYPNSVLIQSVSKYPCCCRVWNI